MLVQAQKVGLVLSGGGAKGLTHIGIIRAYHLSQCIHNRFGIRAKRRGYRSLHLLCIFLPRGQNTISRAVTPG